jgi:hypothetical protein
VEGLHVVGVIFTKDKCLLCVNLCVVLIFMHFIFMGFSCICCIYILVVILH